MRSPRDHIDIRQTLTTAGAGTQPHGNGATGQDGPPLSRAAAPPCHTPGPFWCAGEESIDITGRGGTRRQRFPRVVAGSGQCRGRGGCVRIPVGLARPACGRSPTGADAPCGFGSGRRRARTCVSGGAVGVVLEGAPLDPDGVYRTGGAGWESVNDRRPTPRFAGVRGGFRVPWSHRGPPHAAPAAPMSPDLLLRTRTDHGRPGRVHTGTRFLPSLSCQAARVGPSSSEALRPLRASTSKVVSQWFRPMGVGVTDVHGADGVASSTGRAPPGQGGPLFRRPQFQPCHAPGSMSRQVGPVPGGSVDASVRGRPSRHYHRRQRSGTTRGSAARGEPLDPDPLPPGAPRNPRQPRHPGRGGNVRLALLVL